MQRMDGVMQRNSVDAVQLIMDTVPQIASIRNFQDQNALHICIESNALDCYQALIRCRSPDLDIRSPDIFGQIPVNLWKAVMEEKRSSSTFCYSVWCRLFWIPSWRTENSPSRHRSIHRSSNMRRTSFSESIPFDKNSHENRKSFQQSKSNAHVC